MNQKCLKDMFLKIAFESAQKYVFVHVNILIKSLNISYKLNHSVQIFVKFLRNNNIATFIVYCKEHRVYRQIFVFKIKFQLIKDQAIGASNA